jgi:hypothetical protein
VVLNPIAFSDVSLLALLLRCDPSGKGEGDTGTTGDGAAAASSSPAADAITRLTDEISPLIRDEMNQIRAHKYTLLIK